MKKIVRLPKMKTENILIIIIVVLIVLIVLYWLFTSMRRRNIYESFATSNDGSNYAKNEASKEGRSKQDYHQIFKANIEGNGNILSTKNTKNWNDCANDCANNNNCALFSAVKNGDNITCNFFNKDYDKSKVKYSVDKLSNDNHVWVKTQNNDIKNNIWKELKEKSILCSHGKLGFDYDMMIDSDKDNCYNSKIPICSSGSLNNDNGTCMTDLKCPDGYKVSQADSSKCILNDEKVIDNTKLFCRGGDARIKDNKLQCINNGKLQCDDGYLLGVDNNCRAFKPKECAPGSSLDNGKCKYSACGDNFRFDTKNKRCVSTNKKTPMCSNGYSNYSANNNYCVKN